MRTTGRVFLSPTFAKEGDRVVITCRADINVVWKHNKGELPLDVWISNNSIVPSFINVTAHVDDKVLVIQKAQKMHSGIYTCIGEDSEISHFSEDVQLIVRGKFRMCS